QGRIKLFLSIICAGMPSYNASRALLDQYRPGELPVSLRYRGDGWPGNFKATYADHSEYRVSYNESWGRILGRQILFRCKFCPDGIGLRADLVAGDAWETRNGYPDFTERPGKSFVLVRTPAGVDLFRRAREDGAIQSEKLDIGRLSEMQPFQYQRRVTAGFRVFTVQLLSGFLLNLERIHLLFLMRYTSWYRGMRNVAGISIRFWRLKDLE
ncbi:MAG: Coenzyme F420 hydrogenase/dehydrogenase, beta subunit C-terminal domain, partial [Victivallales bacterium]